MYRVTILTLIVIIVIPYFYVKLIRILKAKTYSFYKNKVWSRSC